MDREVQPLVIQSRWMDQPFPQWTTPVVADAALRAGAAFAVVDERLPPVDESMKAWGRARTVTHFGSVDVFLEAIDEAERGDLLVIDNAGRTDEACIGDLIVAEAAAAGLAGIVCWGRHRDSADILRIGLPVFSTGTCPAGPREHRPAVASSVRIGSVHVTSGALVFADADGVVIVSPADVDAVLTEAIRIYEVERRQAEMVTSGRSLREQFRFADYLARRAKEPGYRFRAHLRLLGGEIEE
jgi:4-hydroxy-4-methyl-2-oxoglutarate aldolase